MEETSQSPLEKLSSSEQNLRSREVFQPKDGKFQKDATHQWMQIIQSQHDHEKDPDLENEAVDRNSLWISPQLSSLLQFTMISSLDDSEVLLLGLNHQIDQW